MNSVNYYDWIDFFRSITDRILEISVDKSRREKELLSLAANTFEGDHRLLKFEVIDPFSFIYALAQRNTKNQRYNIFGRAKAAFGIAAPIPSDFIFPTPTPNTLSLFYAGGEYVDKDGNQVDNDCLWNLFEDTAHGGTISSENLRKALRLKNVGFVKLSQAMFLINPMKYMPFDKQMNSLPADGLGNLARIVEEIEDKGVQVYLDAIEKLKAGFPGCELYEINLLNVLTNSTDDWYLKINNKFFQVSSWADGQNQQDYFPDFVSKSSIWTGGATSSSGGTTYPLLQCDRGDVVLVRRGTKNLGGVGIVLGNDYMPMGYQPEGSIKIVWLIKSDRKIDGDALGQWVGFSHASTKTIGKFREVYPDTFAFLDRIKASQKSMINFSLEKRKNIILQGPPGTGKTRLASQIAEWLTNENEKTLSLIQAIEQNIFTGEPDVAGNPQVKLIQFHPAYNYEDFVRGIKAEPNAQGGVEYVVENRVLAAIAEEAGRPENSQKAYVLIIDEINRANLPAVLGELIYALEYRGKPVNSLYKYDNSHEITIPHNLYVIGTMNTADRSISHLDYAIRRRFSFISVLPNEDAITSVRGKQSYQAIAELFEKYTSPEFKKENVKIGQSYFLGPDEDISIALKYQVLPLLHEYVNDGILLPGAAESINALEEWL